MNDPVRLLETGASDFEAELLRAGRSDAMSNRSRAQILAGIGIGGLLTASTVATGVRAAASKGWLATAGVGAAGALAIWAGVRSQAPQPTPPAPVAVQVAPAARAARPTPEPAIASVAEPEAPAPATPVRVRATPVERDASLTAELAALEQARGAFLRRDYSQTLRLLDEYAHRFPKRQLGSEATVLRIEALAARGDKQSATRIGRDFLQSHPNGPYAQRVRSVVGDASAHAP